ANNSISLWVTISFSWASISSFQNVFYATSLLVTLNTRQTIRHARSQATIERELSTLRFDTRRKTKRINIASSASASPTPPSLSFLNGLHSKSRKLQVEVNVERSVEYKSDMASNSPSTSVS
ncbi:hypothetical protein E4T56_gene14551, partial [Termitomyces sp. T112]